MGSGGKSASGGFGKGGKYNIEIKRVDNPRIVRRAERRGESDPHVTKGDKEFPVLTPGQHGYKLKVGNKEGHLIVDPRGPAGKEDHIDVEYVGAGEKGKEHEAGALGLREVRDIVRFLKNKYPKAKTIGGVRVSGARKNNLKARDPFLRIRRNDAMIVDQLVNIWNDFNPNHGPDGRFSSGSGSGAGGKSYRQEGEHKGGGFDPAARARTSERRMKELAGIKSRIDKVARQHGFEPKQIKTENVSKVKKVVGGKADVHATANTGTGKIDIFTGHPGVNKKTVGGITAHEVQHQKTEAYFKEKMRPGDILPFDSKKYTDLAREASQHPISPYADQHWTHSGVGLQGPEVAVHEQLSEMARLHRQTGKVPGGEAWKKIYGEINDHWKDKRKQGKKWRGTKGGWRDAYRFFVLSDFNPNHGPDGRFSSGSGGGGGAKGGKYRVEHPASTSAKQKASVRSKIEAVARKHDFEPRRIVEKDVVKTRGRGSDKFVVGAEANTRTAKIEVYTGTPTAQKEIKGIIAHEIQHQKTEAYFKHKMDKSGAPAPVTHKELVDLLRELDTGGGISDYSNEHWHNVMTGRGNLDTAVHETLSEMARIEQNTGKLPGGSNWKQLYHEVDGHWRLNRKQKKKWRGVHKGWKDVWSLSDFNPNHGPDGRFSSGSGGGGGKSEGAHPFRNFLQGRSQARTAAKEKAAQFRPIVDRVAKKHDFDPKNIDIDHKTQKGRLTKNLDIAAHAHTDTGKIKIYARTPSLTTKNVGAITAHEIQHHKTETWLRANEGKHGPSGAPFSDKRVRDLVKDMKNHKVSDYSDWAWDQSVNHGAPLNLPVHETLSEMARIHHQTGKLPGGPHWKKLYNEINQHWKRQRRAGKS